jgi:uncharacterized membrane protein YkoI
MKKILASAAIMGLATVPAVALAQHGVDNPQQHNNNVRQEDRQANKQIEAEVEHQANQGQSAVTEQDNDDNVQLAQNNVGISSGQAETIAQAQFPNKSIVKVETEQEDGGVVFSFRFSDGSRVDVNDSGRVVRVEAGSQDNKDRGSRGHDNEQGEDQNDDHSGRD